MYPKAIVDPVAGPAQGPGSDEGQGIQNDRGASRSAASDPKAANLVIGTQTAQLSLPAAVMSSAGSGEALSA